MRASFPTRLFADQVAHEKIHSSSVSVGLFRDAVASSGHDQQVEIFVRLDQRVDDLHG
ncbi:MAG: hypothetical protein ACI8QF_003107 [Limisphaerales bacterium]